MWYVIISACLEGQAHRKMGNQTANTNMPLVFLFGGKLDLG